jgi:predicted nucleotidyltransferase component of viral defense system
MRNLARAAEEERAAYVNETAARRNVPAWMVEKDFWVCWLLGRLFTLDAFKSHLVFKGGTSLSKVFGVIHRFSEDIDLSVSPALLGIDESWLEESDTKTQRDKRMEKLEDLCIQAVRERYAPLLEASIREELGPPGKLWKLIMSVDAVTHSPVVLFEHPHAATYRSYVPPAVKIEFGSLTDQQPIGEHPVRPMIAEQFPDALTLKEVVVVAMEAERTFWEKATILHDACLRPAAKPFNERSSRHYYDTVLLAETAAGTRALARPDLLARVTRFKNLFFASSWSDYASAKPGSFRLVPPEARRAEAEADYAKMQEFFTASPPAFDDLWERLRVVEVRINAMAKH